MNQSCEEQEVYMRFYRRVQLLRHRELAVRGRLTEHPTIVRKDQRIKLPATLLESSKRCLAWFLFLIYYHEEADYQVLDNLQIILNTARNKRYEGSWAVWEKMAIYFNFPSSRELEDKGLGVYRLNLGSRREELEGTVCSPYYFIEFLLNYFCSEDDLFGNYARLVAQYSAIELKVESWAEYQRRSERRKVRRPQRHRGYRDKGSMTSNEELARREANRRKRDKEVTFDPFDHTTTWGIDPKRLNPIDSDESNEGAGQ